MNNFKDEPELERLNFLDVHIQREFRKVGLDFEPVDFDIVSSEKMAEKMVYGPASYDFWSLGRDFEIQKTIWRHTNLLWLPKEIYFPPDCASIYGMDPFPLKLLTVAHVYGHSDFYKNNALMQTQRRDLTAFLARAKDRFDRYRKKYGLAVEETITAARALWFNIDPFTPKGTPSNRDFLAFFIERAGELTGWQKDILSVIREQSYGNFPTRRTKIMNEGWAAYWHEWMMLRLFKDGLVTSLEFDEFIKHNSRVLAEQKTGLNPYLAGREIWKDIEKKQGTKKMFEVRSCYADSLFVEEFLSDEVIRDSKIYIWRKSEEGSLVKWQIVEKCPRIIRAQLVASLESYPAPLISIVESNYNDQGGLCLVHHFDEEAKNLGIAKTELDIEYLQKTLEHVYFFWRKPVRLGTKKTEGGILKKVIYSYNGKKHKHSLDK